MTSINPAARRTLTPAQKRQLFFAGLVLPAVFVLAAVAAMLVALPQLPAEIATHWGADGQADGFASPWLNIGMLPLIGAVMIALIYGGTLYGARRGQSTAWIRFMIATCTGVTVFISIMIAGSTIDQAGLTPAEVLTQGANEFIVVGALAGLLLGAVAALLTPRFEPVSMRGEDVSALPLSASERAVWSQYLGAPAPLWWLMIGVCGLLVVSSAMMLVAAPEAWWAALIPLVVVALSLTTLSWRVTVAPDGLTVRSTMGWPRIHVAAADVANVTVNDVSPLGEFGGYGVRIGGNRRWGVILHNGGSIEVERRGGRRTFVVTVDDAQTGAALLASYGERQEGTAHGTPEA